MKFDIRQMGRDKRPAVSRPQVRTLSEFAREFGQDVRLLGKRVKQMGLVPAIGTSYELKQLQDLCKEPK